MDTARVHPETLAGDLAKLAAKLAVRDDGDLRHHPCVCYEGIVYLGRITLVVDSEGVEVVGAVPCRRCS